MIYSNLDAIPEDITPNSIYWIQEKLWHDVKEHHDDEDEKKEDE